MRSRRLGLAVAAIAALTAWSGSALAYGRADAPLAQIEFSGNCNDPSFPFCAPPPTGVGTGGIWFWVEVDADGTGDIAGAFCGHSFTSHGKGTAGAGSLRGDLTGIYSTRANGISSGASAFPGIVDPGDRYYLITLVTGEKFLFPTTVNHYSFHPVPAVTLQLTVAP